MFPDLILLSFELIKRSRKSNNRPQKPLYKGIIITNFQNSSKIEFALDLMHPINAVVQLQALVWILFA